MTEQRSGAFDSELSVKADGATTWLVLAPLIWTGTKGDTFTVPVGFRTDFATVPRFMHWLVLPYGAYTRAAVLHDWLLTELAAWQKALDDKAGGDRVYLPYQPPANSRDCDGIFRRVMTDLGVPWFKRWIMWAAVRVAALFNGRRAYGRQFGRDAPAVLGMLVLATPFVLPGVAGVLISLGLVQIVTGIQRLAVRPDRPVKTGGGTE
jgi:hypothetical protein